MAFGIHLAIGRRTGIVDDRVILDARAVAAGASVGRTHRRPTTHRSQALMLRSQRAAIGALCIGDAHCLLDRAEPGIVRHCGAAYDLAGITGIAIAIEIDRANRLLSLRGRELPGEQKPADRERDQGNPRRPERSEEHTSELQSLMRISYAVF